MARRIPIDEQETVISWYRNDKLKVYTNDYTAIVKFDKLVRESTEWQLDKERDGAKWYTAPLTAIVDLRVLVNK